MNSPKLGNYYSWDIVDLDTAIKKADKSVFESRFSGIPKDTKWFWNVDKLKNKERIEVILYFNKKKYSSYIQIEVQGRARFFWFSNFVKDLKQHCNYNLEEKLFPSLLFHRKKKNSYSVDIIDGEVSVLDDSHTSNFLSQFEIGLEGGRRVVSSVKIERNRKLRDACIKYHGTSCFVCGFNFEKMYGDLGRGYIEIHHLVPLFIFTHQKEVNPIKDLIPVCANCHRMLHRRKDKVLLVEELKQIIKL